MARHVATQLATTGNHLGHHFWEPSSKPPTHLGHHFPLACF